MSKVSISHERLPEPASVVLDYLNDFEQTIQDGTQGYSFVSRGKAANVLQPAR
jgi:hypothetical protein